MIDLIRYMLRVPTYVYIMCTCVCESDLSKTQNSIDMKAN